MDSAFCHYHSIFVFDPFIDIDIVSFSAMVSTEQSRLFASFATRKSFRSPKKNCDQGIQSVS